MRETITEMLRKDPFQPFWVILTSGDRLEITNPFLIALGQSEIHVLYPRSDRFAVLRWNQVAAVETMDAAA